jgi:hypothetical protein
MHSATVQRRQAFSVWLRTGRVLGRGNGRGFEFKFNPWHDPRNGRFTFAGTGQYFDPGGAGSTDERGQDTPKVEYVDDPTKPPIASVAEANAWAIEQLAKYGEIPGYPEAIEARLQLYREAFAKSSRDPVQQVANFAAGVGEGMYHVAEGAVTGLYTLFTTNPVTTVRNIGLGIAGTVDAAIAAEDTPAYVHFAQAANSVANASAYDIGYGLGAITGNFGLAIAPGAAVARISAVRKAGEVGGLVAAAESSGARFGIAASSDYRTTFFNAYPDLKNKVVVHHAVERQVLERFAGTVTEGEIHSLENLRGVPSSLNSDLHLSKIRTEWNRFYKVFEARGMTPTKAQLLQKAADIDAKYGSQFNPPR